MVSRTIEFYDNGRTWRNTVSNDSVIHSVSPDKITFSHVSPQDTVSYAQSTDKIHYTRGQVMGSIQRRSAFKKVFVAPPPPPTDPYFSNVVALLHADGADGSTVFTDVKGHTFTAVGNAQIDTAQYTYGGASCLLDGAGDYVWAADSNDWDFGTGDFTIQISVRFVALPSANVMTLVSNYPSAGSWGLQFVNDSPGARLRLLTAEGAVTYNFTWSPSLNTWYRIGVKRAGTNLSAWVNEAQVGSTLTSSDNIAGSTGQLWIGGANTLSQYLNGWWDELRITKGVARDLSVAPTGPFLDL